MYNNKVNSVYISSLLVGGRRSLRSNSVFLAVSPLCLAAVHVLERAFLNCVAGVPRAVWSRNQSSWMGCGGQRRCSGCPRRPSRCADSVRELYVKWKTQIQGTVCWHNKVSLIHRKQEIWRRWCIVWQFHNNWYFLLAFVPLFVPGPNNIKRPSPLEGSRIVCALKDVIAGLIFQCKY